MNQQLVIDDLCIEIQASPRRKSIALQVNARGVVCKTPLKYNKKDLHHWLATKAEWIEKQQILMTNIDRSFQEEMINDMDMGEPLYRL